MSDGSTKVQVGGSGIGLGGLVFLVLLVLKLTGTAAISWFWVFFPLWIVPAVVIGLLLAGGLIAGLIFAGAKLLSFMPGRRLKKRSKW